VVAISVISVNYGDVGPLERTCRSVDRQSTRPHQHIVVASGVTDELARKVRRNLAASNRSFVINQDRSIYNAMNIGISEATGDAVLFLNGGDELLSDEAIKMISRNWRSRACLAFRTIQRYQGDSYVRPSADRLELLRANPCHQGFVAPLEQATADRILFDEEFSADTRWMKKHMAKYEVRLMPDVLSCFELGGISNFPSLESVATRYRSDGLGRAVKEVVKLMMRLVVGSRMYYRVLARYHGYEVCPR